MWLCVDEKYITMEIAGISHHIKLFVIKNCKYYIHIGIYMQRKDLK